MKNFLKQYWPILVLIVFAGFILNISFPKEITVRLKSNSFSRGLDVNVSGDVGISGEIDTTTFIRYPVDIDGGQTSIHPIHIKIKQ